MCMLCRATSHKGEYDKLFKKAIELKHICETTGECICCPREAKKACKDLCDYGAICWLTDIDTHELVEYLKRKDDEEHC